MRTTIRLEDSLLREAKARAARAGRSLNDFIADAVRLAVQAKPARASAVEIPVFRGGHGVQPGVDLDSNSALLELMEEGDRPR